MQRKHPLAICEECSLFQEGEYVPTATPNKASIAIVGEAPGFNESRNGVPFTGASGKLLDSILGHYGIERDEVLLSNACLCREPSGENPTKANINACRPRLISELQDSAVGTIVALGNSACESILGKSGITKLRIGPGQISNFLPGVKVIPTLHPAAALRQADIFPTIVGDFGKINRKLEEWIPPRFVVVDNEQEAVRVLHDIEVEIKPEMLVIDIEVDIEKDKSHGHPNQFGMLCVGIGYAPGCVVVLGENAMQSKAVQFDLGEMLKRIVHIVAQNGKFDSAGLYPLLKQIEIWFDTLLAHYILDERPGIHDLEQMGVEILGTPSWKSELDKHKKPGQGYGVIPREVLYKYNAYDCSVTYDLALDFIRQLAEQDENDTFYLKAGKMVKGRTLREAHDFLVKASNELMFVELSGIGVDHDYISTLAEILKDNLGFLEIKLNMQLPEIEWDNDNSQTISKDYDKQGGVNPRSPIQLLKVFKDFGMYTKSTDEETCTKIIEMKGVDSHIGRFCTTLLEHRGESKNYGTYVKGIQERLYGGRIYPSFLLHGTTNGRLSCRNPNLQNIPRKSAIRRLFVPTKAENVFLQTDYAQAELRVLSWLAGDTYFSDIFNEGLRDVFDELSQEVLFPQYPKATTDPELYKDIRVRVKAYVYGLAYGRTEYGISREYGIPVDDALRDLRKFFTVIPEIVKWQSDIKNLVKNGNDLVTPFGRHRRFHLITKQNHDDVMREALAFVPSSTSSDICLNAFVNVRQETKGFAWVRNLVHDSILVECNENVVDEVKEIVERCMLDSAYELVGDFVKFAVDSKIGRDWGSV